VTGRLRIAATIVSRNYQAAPDYCARALELLLKKPICKKAAEVSGGEDARKEDPNASGNVSISR
jgi:hypothetical protein